MKWTLTVDSPQLGELVRSGEDSQVIMNEARRVLEGAAHVIYQVGVPVQITFRFIPEQTVIGKA